MFNSDNQIIRALKPLIDVIEVFEKLGLHQSIILNGNLQQLYRVAKEEPDADDNYLRRKIFPDSKKSNARIYLWQLKSKLTDQLISHILQVDLDERWTSFQRGYFKVWKRYAYTRILIGIGLRQVAISIAEKSLKYSLSNHFTELVLNFSRILRDHYARYGKDKKKYIYYQTLSRNYFALLQQEDFIEDLYNELILFDATVAQNRGKKDYQGLVNPVLEMYKTFRIHYLGYTIKVLSYQINGEYLKAVEACEQAVSSLDSFPDYSTPSFTFRLRKIPNLLQMKLYGEAETSIRECLDLVGASKHNWLIIHHYKVILQLHNQEWDAALKVVRNVEDEKAKLPETWYIYKAYAQILKGNQDFKLGKFLNQIGVLSKEKRGMNIHVRVIEILYYLLSEQHGKIIDMQEALREYSKRHLRKDQATFRSDVFMRMLLLLPRYSFRSIGIDRSAKPYLKKLADNPRDMVLQDTDLEVVPFEILWEWVLTRLH